ncbi:MAG: UDP-N-acetylmuramoyl-L-alanyl-D-glutamate--2,6-diaminopimelate ligase, partial [Phycisphaerales bacterium JB059]
MNLGTLIEGLGVRVVRGDPASVRVCDLTEDSRTAVPGSLFVARRGQRSDGRRFIESAIECGASCVLTDDASVELPPRTDVCLLVTEDVPGVSARLAERFYAEPSSRLVLIGVTGTNGKTTVAHLTHQLLNQAGVRTGLIGTVEVDDGREVAPASMTTPPAIELSRTLAQIVEHRGKAAVMEVSSHALDQGRAGALAFDIAVFTNLSGDHLDYHQTMDAYAAAKASLFAMLPEDGVAILNADDPASAKMVGGRRITCSATGAGDWRVEAGDGSLDGTPVSIRGPGVRLDATVPLFGAHNAMNTLEAVAAASETLRRLGRSDESIEADLRDAIPRLRAPAGRMERVSTSADGPVVFVDFAHTDDALDKTLASVRPLVPEGRDLWVVVGCGGDKDQSKRPRMGHVASTHATRCVFTSDNPRTEPPAEIIRAMLQGVPLGARSGVVVHPDRARAIREAVGGAAPGDVI